MSKPLTAQERLRRMLAIVPWVAGQPDGATIEEIVTATGWLCHTVRGVMSGALKKKLGLTITSEKGGTKKVRSI